MLKVSKVGVLVAVMALSGLLASSAGAAEWHTNGPMEVTSTDAGPSRLAVHTATGVIVVQCATSSGTVTLRGPTIVGSTAPGIATVQPRFGGACTVSGAAGYSVNCDEAELNANTFSGGLLGGIASGTITNIECRILIGAGTLCSSVTGSVNAHYTNPTVATGTNGFGRLTVTTAGQNLTVTKVGAGCAALPNGAGTFGTQGAGSTVGNLTYTVDGPHAPRITRTG